MTEPTQDSRSKSRVPPEEIAPRPEKITRTFRADSPSSKRKPGTLLEVTREYRARAVLSYHRFLGRWTAP
jgi:hypothetical protein